MQIAETMTLQTRQAERALEYKIGNRSARLGVIGLGYVGLPLGTAMAQQCRHTPAPPPEQAEMVKICDTIFPCEPIPFANAINPVGNAPGMKVLAVIEAAQTK